jgi:hypothetical protein
MTISAQIIAPPQTIGGIRHLFQLYLAKSDAGSTTVTDIFSLKPFGIQDLPNLIGTVIPGSGNVTVPFAVAVGASGTPDPTALAESLVIRTSDGTNNVITIPSSSSLTVTSFNGLNSSELPSAPQTFAAATGAGASGTLALTWVAPASAGNSSITGYVAVAMPGGIVKTGLSGTSGTFTGLTAGTSYSVRLFAINSQGQGPYSAPSTATAHS